MLIMVYFEHENSYDSFHKNADRICWVQSKLKFGNDSIFIPAVSYVAGPMVKQGVPAVEDFVRLEHKGKNTLVQNPASESLKFTEDKFYFADKDFFSFFSFTLQQGDRKSLLDKPFTVVLSAKAANKYFGNDNPIGKTIVYNNKYNFTVTGVAGKVPSNSSIDFDFVASMASINGIDEEKGNLKSDNIDAGAFTTYFLLKHKNDINQLAAGINKLAQTGSKDDQGNTAFIVTALTKTHLDFNETSESNIKYLSLFPLVAGLILLLALINYMSLATARSAGRAKEIGVRKTMGANRKSIAVQFFIESCLYTSISFALAYFLCLIIQPPFFNFLGIDVDASFLQNSGILFSFFALYIVTIILAATYPSILLSAYKPIKVLYGRLAKQTGALSVRKFFTVFQFTISVGLIICGIVIDRQMYFFKHFNTGINRQNVLMVPFATSMGKHYGAFKKDVQSIAAVKQVGTAHYPMYKGYDIFMVTPKGGQQPVTLPVFSVDENFISLLGLQWKVRPDDSLFYNKKGMAVLNEAAVEKLGLGNNPLHQNIDSQFEVAGVVKNFNFASLQNKIEALSLFVSHDNNDTASAWGRVGGCIFIKLQPNANEASVIQMIKTAYDKYDRQKPFEYYFMDDAYDAMYKAEDKMHKIFSVFTVFTIIIASLGLFGLTAFMATQRTKEVGIRKVLGATVPGIAILLSKEFIQLVLIAIIIASPLAWWAMHSWLQGFAYRVDIAWWMFAVAAAGAVIVAVATISYQAIKAAVANPVKSLRSE